MTERVCVREECEGDCACVRKYQRKNVKECVRVRKRERRTECEGERVCVSVSMCMYVRGGGLGGMGNAYEASEL